MFNLRFSILIAEDETIIREDIAEKVSSIHQNFCVVGQAQDGEEALEMISRLHPDVLITDIEMPRMSGIELIKLVRRQYPDVHIIILSGFDNFSYAQSAIKYNVTDYLLKPVSIGQLSDTLMEIYEKTTESAHSRCRTMLQQSIKGEPVTSSPGLTDRSKQYDIYLILIGNLPQKGDLLSVPRLRDLDQHHIVNVCSSSLCEQELYIFDEGLPNHKFVITSAHQPGNGAKLFTALQRLFAPTPVSICVPGCPVSIEELRHCTVNLQRLMEHSVIPCQSGFYSLKNTAARDFQIHENILVMRFAKLISAGDFDLFENEFCSFFSERLLPQRYFEHILTRIVMRADSASDRSVSVSAIPLIQQTCTQSVHRHTMLHDLCHLFRSEFSAQETDIVRPEDVISQIAAYLKENFREPVSIESLSSMFSFNASYLIRLFKKSMGITPTQYIINLRIEEAKRLMTKEPSLTLRQVSELCGYPDQHYFSRIFKHATGLSPSDYRLYDSADQRP